MASVASKLLLTACLAASFGAAADAQWLNFPAAGVPRLADGTPDLDAPAPRGADRKPDLSGIWYLRLPGSDPASAEYAAGPEFFNIGASLPEEKDQ